MTERVFFKAARKAPKAAMPSAAATVSNVDKPISIEQFDHRVAHAQWQQAAIAQEVAASVDTFPSGLLKLICRYLFWNTASIGADAKLLLSIELHNVAGVAVSGGNIWASVGDRVFVYSEAKCLFTAGGRSLWRQPVGLAAAACGEVFVVDSGFHVVTVCKGDGFAVRQFGALSRDAPGYFENPVALAVDSVRDLVFVIETGTHMRVQVLRSDGRFVRQFGSYGQRDDLFSDVSGIAVNGSRSGAGEVFIADRLQHTIKVFDYNGKFLRKLFSGSDLDFVPVGIAFDHAGNVLTCNGDSILVVKPDGTRITSFRDRAPQREGYQELLRCLCVADDGRILAGCRDKLAVFGFEYNE